MSVTQMQHVALTSGTWKTTYASSITLGSPNGVLSSHMSAFKTPDFNDRQSAAVKARLAALEKFKAKPGPGHPEFEKKQAERIALEIARKEREEIRRIEKDKRDAEEAAARALAEEERRKAELAAHLASIAEKAELEASQKAARDARYAARKAAKKARKAG